jgi:hypothetical protein
VKFICVLCSLRTQLTRSLCNFTPYRKLLGDNHPDNEQNPLPTDESITTDLLAGDGTTMEFQVGFNHAWSLLSIITCFAFAAKHSLFIPLFLTLPFLFR